MVLHNCDICSKGFKLKTDLERHKNKKNKCFPKRIDDIEQNINHHQNTTIGVTEPPTTPPIYTNKNILNDDVIERNKCINCDKNFTRSDSYNRHVLFRCKKYDKQSIKNKDVIQLLSEIKEQQIQMKDEHKQEIQELRNTINELRERKGGSISSSVINTNSNNTNNNNTNNTTNNTINNIILKFDDIDAYKRLDKKDIQYIMDAQAEYLIQRSIEVTHCNKKYPELHNVYIPDKKMQYAVAYTGSKFEMRPVDKVVKALIVSQQNNICDYLDMADIQISERNRERFDDMAENFMRYEDSRSENNREMYKNALSDIKVLLYNNKEQGKKAEDKIKRRKKASIQELAKKG